MEGYPVLECALELLKIQKFGHVFYSVFVRLPFTLSMVKECMDPVTCMLPVMLPILLEPACPVFVLRFVLFFALVGALSPPTLLPSKYPSCDSIFCCPLFFLAVS